MSKAATTTVPVVFITGDPVAEKFVASLARPGGNLTGMALLASDLDVKRLEILQQQVPRAKRVAVILNPSQARLESGTKDLEDAGKRLGLTLLMWQARNGPELDAAFAEIAAAKIDALHLLADPVYAAESRRIVEFASRQRLPSIHAFRLFAQRGGLASYGTNLAAVFRRAAVPVDRILRGAKPGDMPIEQPTTFEFVINLKAAKEQGIEIPLTLRQRADELIE